MKRDVSALQRAFELARSGTFKSVTEIKKALKCEGYNPDEIAGPGLAQQLRRIMDAEARCLLAATRKGLGASFEDPRQTPRFTAEHLVAARRLLAVQSEVCKK